MMEFPIALRHFTPQMHREVGELDQKGVDEMFIVEGLNEGNHGFMQSPKLAINQ